MKPNVRRTSVTRPYGNQSAGDDARDERAETAEEHGIPARMAAKIFSVISGLSEPSKIPASQFMTALDLISIPRNVFEVGGQP